MSTPQIIGFRCSAAMKEAIELLAKLSKHANQKNEAADNPTNEKGNTSYWIRMAVSGYLRRFLENEKINPLQVRSATGDEICKLFVMFMMAIQNAEGYGFAEGNFVYGPDVTA